MNCSAASWGNIVTGMANRQTLLSGTRHVTDINYMFVNADQENMYVSYIADSGAASGGEHHDGHGRANTDFTEWYSSCYLIYTVCLLTLISK